MSSKESSILNVFITTHLWLGLSASICTWGTFVVLHQPVSFVYLGFVLGGTMTIYNIHSLLSKIRQNQLSTSGSVPAFLYTMILLGSALTTTLYLILDRSNQMILLLPTCIAILYVFPVYRGKRLKDYPFVKIIAIMIAWTTVTFWIPIHAIPQWWEEAGYNYLIIDRLLFFFALAIPFDIRDMKYDRKQSLKTIPNTIGLNNSQYLAIFSLCLACGFMFMGFNFLSIKPIIKFGLIATYGLLGVMIIRLKHLPDSRYYSWFIDGILLLYGVVILFLSG